MAEKSPFRARMQLKDSALALQADLRVTQNYAMSEKDGYKYYGLRFYDSLGVDILPSGEPLRQGWKILRYEPKGLTPPVNLNSFTVIKSSESTVDNPQLVDKTFFASDRITINTATSEFITGTPTPPKLNATVFTDRGSATDNGQNLLTLSNDTIVLSGYGHAINITITPLTGHTEVGDMQ